MKIIKHGNGRLIVHATPIAECPTCGCVFLFKKQEARKLTNNGGGWVYFRSCPECGDNACVFDTGYDDRYPDSDARVKALHARLRILSETTNTP